MTAPDAELERWINAVLSPSAAALWMAGYVIAPEWRQQAMRHAAARCFAEDVRAVERA